jgi:hypothetical protein
MASLTGGLLLGEDVAAKVIASAIVFFYLFVLLRDNLFPFKPGRGLHDSASKNVLVLIAEGVTRQLAQLRPFSSGTSKFSGQHLQIRHHRYLLISIALLSWNKLIPCIRFDSIESARN